MEDVAAGAGEAGGDGSGDCCLDADAAGFGLPTDLERFVERAGVSFPLSVFSLKGRFREGKPGELLVWPPAGELGSCWLRPLMVGLAVKKLVSEACFFSAGLEEPAIVD